MLATSTPPRRHVWIHFRCILLVSVPIQSDSLLTSVIHDRLHDTAAQWAGAAEDERRDASCAAVLLGKDGTVDRLLRLAAESYQGDGDGSRHMSWDCGGTSFIRTLIVKRSRIGLNRRPDDFEVFGLTDKFPELAKPIPDPMGNSSILQAWLDVLRLLLKHGYKVTSSDVLRVIDNKDCPALRALVRAKKQWALDVPEALQNARIGIRLIGAGGVCQAMSTALLQDGSMADFYANYGFRLPSAKEMHDREELSVHEVSGFLEPTLLCLLKTLSSADLPFTDGQTELNKMLGLAAENHFSNVVKFLMVAGANPLAHTNPRFADTWVTTPVHEAVRSRCIDCLVAFTNGSQESLARTYLQAMGQAKMADGQTAVDLARRIGSLDAVKLFDGTGVDHHPTSLGETCQVGSSPHHGKAPRHALDGWAVSNSSIWDSEVCELPVVHVEKGSWSLTLKEIAKNLQDGIPMLVRGGSRVEVAFDTWTKSYLLRKLKDARVSAGAIPYPKVYGDRFLGEVRDVTFPQYVNEVMGQETTHDGTPLMLFGLNMEWSGWIDIENDFTMVDKVLPTSTSTAVSPTNHLQFSLGPALAGSPHHYHTNSYAMQFHGRKRWLFWPKPHNAIGRRVAWRTFQDWDREVANEVSASDPALVAAQRRQRVFACVQDAGDAMLVPSQVGHATLNIGDALGVVQEFDIREFT